MTLILDEAVDLTRWCALRNSPAGVLKPLSRISYVQMPCSLSCAGPLHGSAQRDRTSIGEERRRGREGEGGQTNHKGVKVKGTGRERGGLQEYIFCDPLSFDKLWMSIKWSSVGHHKLCDCTTLYPCTAEWLITETTLILVVSQLLAGINTMDMPCCLYNLL